MKKIKKLTKIEQADLDARDNLFGISENKEAKKWAKLSWASMGLSVIAGAVE